MTRARPRGRRPCASSEERRPGPPRSPRSVATSRAAMRVASGGATTTTPSSIRVTPSSTARPARERPSLPHRRPRRPTTRSIWRAATASRFTPTPIPCGPSIQAVYAPAAARLSSRIAERHVDLVGGRDERRDDPDDVDVRAGGQDDQVALERLGLDPLGQVRVGRPAVAVARLDELDGDHQPEAADVADRRVAARQARAARPGTAPRARGRWRRGPRPR